MGGKRVGLYGNPVIFENLVKLDKPYFHFKVEQFFYPKVAGHLLYWLQNTNLYKSME